MMCYCCTYIAHLLIVEDVLRVHVDQADVVRQQHAHHRLRRVRAEDPPLEPRLLRQVGKARRVVQVKMRHQEEVDLIIGWKRRGRTARSDSVKTIIIIYFSWGGGGR